MLIEIGIVLYLLIGLFLYVSYINDIKEHSSRTVVSKYIKRILYIVAFFVTVLMWPLLLGA